MKIIYIFCLFSCLFEFLFCSELETYAERRNKKSNIKENFKLKHHLQSNSNKENKNINKNERKDENKHKPNTIKLKISQINNNRSFNNNSEQIKDEVDALFNKKIYDIKNLSFKVSKLKNITDLKNFFEQLNSSNSTKFTKYNNSIPVKNIAVKIDDSILNQLSYEEFSNMKNNSPNFLNMTTGDPININSNKILSYDEFLKINYNITNENNSFQNATRGSMINFLKEEVSGISEESTDPDDPNTHQDEINSVEINKLYFQGWIKYLKYEDDSNMLNKPRRFFKNNYIHKEQKIASIKNILEKSEKNKLKSANNHKYLNIEDPVILY